MIKVRDCAFQDGSYPCGYKDEGELPDCKLCHKIRKAGVEEVVGWIDREININAKGYFNYPIEIDIEEWQAKLREWGIEPE